MKPTKPQTAFCPVSPHGDLDLPNIHWLKCEAIDNLVKCLEDYTWEQLKMNGWRIEKVTINPVTKEVKSVEKKRYFIVFYKGVANGYSITGHLTKISHDGYINQNNILAQIKEPDPLLKWALTNIIELSEQDYHNYSL